MQVNSPDIKDWPNGIIPKALIDKMDLVNHNLIHHVFSLKNSDIYLNIFCGEWMRMWG